MPDCRPHSGMLFCQLDSHSTRPSLPHVLLHPPCQHVRPSEQPFVVVAQMELLYTSFHYCCIPHNKSTINMHIHICTDYNVFPVELLHNGGDYGDYFIATPTSLVMSNGTWYWLRIHHHIPLKLRNLGYIWGYSQTECPALLPEEGPMGPKRCIKLWSCAPWPRDWFQDSDHHKPSGCMIYPV